MHESETRQQFPKMVYLGGVPSGVAGDFRIVNDPQALDDAQAEGFTAYDPASKGRAPAPIDGDPKPPVDPEEDTLSGEGAPVPAPRAPRTRAPKVSDPEGS